MAKGGMHGEGGGACMAKEGSCMVCMASHCVGGMHPTGMHSCF